MRLEHLVGFDLWRFVPTVLRLFRNHLLVHVDIDLGLALGPPIKRHVLQLNRLRVREPKRRQILVCCRDLCSFVDPESLASQLQLIVAMPRLLHTLHQIYYFLRTACRKFARGFVNLHYFLCVEVEHVALQALEHFKGRLALIEELRCVRQFLLLLAFRAELLQLLPFHVKLLFQLAIHLALLIEFLDQRPVLLLQLLVVQVHCLQHLVHQLVFLGECLHFFQVILLQDLPALELVLQLCILLIQTPALGECLHGLCLEFLDEAQQVLLFVPELTDVVLHGRDKPISVMRSVDEVVVLGL